jgi:hypothetical protein
MTPPSIGPKVRYRGRKIPISRDAMRCADRYCVMGMTRREAVATMLYVWGYIRGEDAMFAATDGFRAARARKAGHDPRVSDLYPPLLPNGSIHAL